MFERFTDRARRVLVLAQEEARDLNHNFIGTEHILLGLIHESDGVAAKALGSLGISLERVREKVGETIGAAGSSTTGAPFTPRAKKVLELSLREALQLGHNYIGTEHMLLGLVREGEGVAAQVLVSLGADLCRVRHQVIQLVSGDRPPEAAGAAEWELHRAPGRAALPGLPGGARRPRGLPSSPGAARRRGRRVRNDRCGLRALLGLRSGHSPHPRRRARRANRAWSRHSVARSAPGRPE